MMYTVRVDQLTRVGARPVEKARQLLSRIPARASCLSGPMVIIRPERRGAYLEQFVFLSRIIKLFSQINRGEILGEVCTHSDNSLGGK